ncbi:MAG: hypothetical protein EOO46_19635 [Flavobacterium sp.]|nr:MAG: hypothetical protein EOO46_19635 [Flavobacterium sp.]
MIPWFLIKKTITEQGSGVRDMELSFTIDTARFSKIYAGRSILPEKVDDFGPLNDFQKEKENPYSRDYLICGKCEENLSRLEAIFATEFNEKRINVTYQARHKLYGDHVLMISQNFNFNLYALFVQSIFYRCSIGRFDGFSLQKKIELKVEENLRKAFTVPNFKKIVPSTHIDLLHSFPLLSCVLYTPSGEDPTKQYITLGRSRFPYFLMAGKWMFQLFEAEKHLKSTIEWLYGLKQTVNPVSAFEISNGQSHLFLLNEASSKSIAEDVKNHFVQKKIEGLKRNIRELHRHIFGNKPSDFIAQFIYRNYFKHLEQDKNEFDAFVYAFLDLKSL